MSAAVVFLIAVSYRIPVRYIPPASVPVESAASGEHSVSAVPLRLRIPRIGVDATIQSVGLTTDGSGEMAVPTNFTDVGWYEKGPRPGALGSAVIAGHYNGRNVPRGVFFDLHRLETGDHVLVTDEARVTHTFKVVAVRTYTHDAPTAEVFVGTDMSARLNLITCAGNWLSALRVFEERTVVFTELVSESE